jgi:DNA-binding transcriptional MerR regulator
MRPETVAFHLMNQPVLVTLQVAAQVLNVRPNRIIHLCGTGVVEPAVNATGRGKVRRFDRNDIFLLAVALRLQDAGLAAPVIRDILRIFDYLAKTKEFRTEIRRVGLRDFVAGLGSTPPESTTPNYVLGEMKESALLHVRMPWSDDEFEYQTLLQGRGLDSLAPPAKGYGFCSVATAANWLSRLTINLTALLRFTNLR